MVVQPPIGLAPQTAARDYEDKAKAQVVAIPIVYGPYPSATYTQVKRFLDVLLATFFLVVCAPLMVFVTIVLRISSPESVFFSQVRHGLHGRTFSMIKFRTMRVSESGFVAEQVKPGDRRLTRFGRLLRRTSIDELPQLICVLKGQMSLVGPRPHAVCHNESFASQLPNYQFRHLVKPGITGLAQVNGARGHLANLEAVRKRLRYDLEYVQCCSTSLDLKILLRTIFSVKTWGLYRSR